MPDVKAAEEVVGFWFQVLTPKQWFAKDDDLDRRIQQDFGMTLEAAAAGELWQWRRSARV